MEQVRWKQRFNNLEKAFQKLKRGLDLFDFELYQEKRVDLRKNLDTENEQFLMGELEQLDLEREGLIQRFEYTFELFLLTMKDYMKFTGEAPEEISGNSGILKKALSRGIIEDHDGWRKMLKSRNLTSHTYNEETADEITRDIIEIFFPLMQKLYITLEQQYFK
ncbi:nucleotidyltransferase substrate binding protein [Salinimicrobium sp. GXAS 041]|uniref:nucleotidyltransferase substrate binding protein n=1 Tax=Salinimicrobium sp. GXAS 041 TaxID=3400806 RepID=UPI003C722FBA